LVTGNLEGGSAAIENRGGGGVIGRGGFVGSLVSAGSPITGPERLPVAWKIS